MADPDSGVFRIPSSVVDLILLGPADDRRQLQDSPILGDVWLAYAIEPRNIQDLLITPHREATAGQVASRISQSLTKIAPTGKAAKSASIIHLQGIVAARLYFKEVLRIVVPLTAWWREKEIPAQLKKKRYDTGALRGRIADLFRSVISATKSSPQAPSRYDFTALDRYVALAGLILWAAEQEWQGRSPPEKEDVLNAVTSNAGAIVDGLLALFDQIKKDGAAAQESPLIFQVSLNRDAAPALTRSVPAVKADAARRLFGVDCSKIAWAILDSGIDHTHPAFKDAAGDTRIKQTFDFTRVRDLEELAEDASKGVPTNWDIVEERLRVDDPQPPRSQHGTHVAGILGAIGIGKDTPPGMCPDIKLYDFRVLADTMKGTELAVIAALQYIRFLNERFDHITIHGANLSLSIPHNVRNYACGRTPVCNECQRLVESGVVVVAAAGNRGYQRFETKEGLFENYAAFSVTDPGNADDVITVGSTHPSAPHSYGVSFFSSRGPTGDGRLKPDLVAPGERIQAPIPGKEWAQETGTSMAAPHVSGAAAMLMARYGELIGQPRRIKRILCDSATDLGRERSFQGHGMLDVLRAFQSI